MSLKDPGAVLLISCYELGHQPFSVASPLGWLHRAGYRPAAIDLAVDRLDPDRVAAARFIAISVPMHTALRLGARALDRVRALNPGAFLCFYGLYAALNGDHLLARGADAVIGGEFEAPLLALIEGREQDRAAPVPGVRTRRGDSGPWIGKIDFAVPARAGLPALDRYARLEADGTTRIAGQVEASRGCLHHCRHCPIPPVYGGRFFVVPRDVVLADIRAQVEAGAAHITFGDPDFLNGPGHALAVARDLHADFPGVTFDFTAKIEHLLKHASVLPEFRGLGCLFIVSAVESLSDRVLGILDKGHTRNDVVQALRLTREAGIALRPSFVPFTPWTTLPDYTDLLDFIAREDLIDHLDPVQLAIRLLLPPGSLLLDRPEVGPHLGILHPDRFTWTWIHPDPEMDRLQEEVSQIVEEAARPAGVATQQGGSAAPWGDVARVTFEAIVARTAAAGRAAGQEIDLPRLPLPPSPADKGRPPRLTEPWFC